MGLFDMFMPHDSSNAEGYYNDIYYTQQVQPHHQSSWTHEAVAGAAGFAAMHAYEAHLRATGQQPSHELMKEILAGIAAAEVDKLAETKGLDWIDRHQAKKMAAKQAHNLAESRYGGGTGYEYAQAQQGGYAAAYQYGGVAPFMYPQQSMQGGYGGGYQPPQPYQGGYMQQQPQYGGYGGQPLQPQYGGYGGQPMYPNQGGVVYENAPGWQGDGGEHHHHHHHHGGD